MKTWRVFLAGEGANELGQWYHEAMYRQQYATTHRDGVLGALLTLAGVRYQVVGAVQWMNIRKYSAGEHRKAEQQNLEGARRAAIESSADALVFVRDTDGDTKRQRQIESLFDELTHDEGGLRVVGGVAVKNLECWLVALDGKRDSESGRRLVVPGVRQKNTEDIVDFVSSATSERIAKDARSLLAWLASARTLTISQTEGGG